MRPPPTPTAQNVGLLLLKKVFNCFKNRPGKVSDFVITIFADFYDKWNLGEDVCTEPVQAKGDELDFFLPTN